MKTIKVGDREPKVVTPENHELYLKAFEIMDNGINLYGDLYSAKAEFMGKIELSKLIDYIEDTYGLEKRADNNKEEHY